jgi:2',3'-cyclic-nucleotide 2'-phosphodiesterase (5'-nucleotidase family)
VRLLQEQQCEVLLALTHLNLHQDKEVAQACPALHAILGGHDHDPHFLVHHGVLIAKCGQNAATLQIEMEGCDEYNYS